MIGRPEGDTSKDGEGETTLLNAADERAAQMSELEANERSVLAWLYSHFGTEEARSRDLRAVLEEKESRRIIAQLTAETERGSRKAKMRSTSREKCGDDADDECTEASECLVEELPAETLVNVFVCLEEPMDVLSCMLTCRRWAALFGVMPCAYLVRPSP